MVVDVEIAMRADDLQTAAGVARTQAESARELALELERHRTRVVERDDDSLARHIPTTWSSRAASVSRTELQRVVGFSLWSAAHSLAETRIALEDHATLQDELSQSYRDQADEILATATTTTTTMVD